MKFNLRTIKKIKSGWEKILYNLNIQEGVNLSWKPVCCIMKAILLILQVNIFSLLKRFFFLLFQLNFCTKNPQEFLINDDYKIKRQSANNKIPLLFAGTIHGSCTFNINYSAVEDKNYINTLAAKNKAAIKVYLSTHFQN